MQKLTIVACLFFSIIIQAQILNSSFEEWEEIFYPPLPGTDPFLYENPLSWDVNQSPGLERVQKSNQSTEGSFSLKLIPSTGSAFNGCASVLNYSIDFNNPIENAMSLYFDYKATSLNSEGNVYSQINLYFFQDGTLIGSEEWGNLSEVPEFEAIEISLIEGADKMNIEIKGASASNYIDQCVKESFIWIDNLRIEPSILGVNTNKNIDFTLFPNPVESKLIISNSNNFPIIQVHIYNALGFLVKQVKGNVSQINIAELPTGVYFLNLETEKGSFTKKVVKE